MAKITLNRLEQINKYKNSNNNLGKNYYNLHRTGNSNIITPYSSFSQISNSRDLNKSLNINNGNLKAKKQLLEVTAGEQVLSEAKQVIKLPKYIPTKYKCFGTTYQEYEIINNQFSIVNGEILFKVTKFFNTQEYCEYTPIEPEKLLYSYKTIINHDNIDNIVYVTHSLRSSIVDCSIRYYDQFGNNYRVITSWEYVDVDTIEICLPQQITLLPDNSNYFEIIVYNLADFIPDPDTFEPGEYLPNIFKYQIFTIDQNPITLQHQLNSNIIDSAPYYNVLKSNNSIYYEFPSNNIHDILLYTCEKSIRIPVTNARKNQLININHGLNRRCKYYTKRYEWC